MTLDDIIKLAGDNKDMLIVAALVMILSRENADKGLVYALVFLLI